MKKTALIAGLALATCVVDAGAAGRFRPAEPDYVVMRVPARSAADPIALLEQQRATAPGDEQQDARLAELYLERARAERQPRYFARAEAIVQPWVARPDAGAATLRVQADILQNRHEFGAAVGLLDRAIARDPRDSGARLMRASVRFVQGEALQARSDCGALMTAGESTVGTICLAQALGVTGGLVRAEALLSALTNATTAGEMRGSSASSSRQSFHAWALWLLADFADRRGDVAVAEERLRAALAAAPENEGIRSALSDMLAARGAHREASALTDVSAPSIGLLVRRARAQAHLNDPALSDTRAQIDELLTLSRRRGEIPHLREEALIALDVDHDPQRALALSKANFQSQRETIDLRLLVRAARACNDSAALTEVSRWIQHTGYEDHALSGGQS
jgi:tetratricopeptide (TPR) repeat protein